MTIDEKLSHFYDITVEEAHEKAAAILDEHKSGSGENDRRTQNSQ